mmetsp:Transcript_29315/g.93807  ORF Transcript_29315/g.93807 Transcript_29315/m.93807 type:complete len:315 (-) Transcript_29315:15-959(-)
MEDQVHALLRHKARDANHQWFVRVDLEAQPGLHVLLAHPFPAGIGRIVWCGDEWVVLRVPQHGVDAIENAVVLLQVLRQGRVEPARRAVVDGLLGVGGGHRGDDIAVHDATFEQGHAFGIVADSPLVHGSLQGVECLAGESRDVKFFLSALAGVVHIVDSEHHLGVGHFLVVRLPVDHSRRAALPLVHVDDVRLPSTLTKKFEPRAAEVKVRLQLVVAPAVDSSPAENVGVVPIRPQHDDVTAPNLALPCAGLEGGEVELSIPHPPLGAVEIHDVLEAFYLLIGDAFVVRHEDLHVVASFPAGAGEALHGSVRV